MKSIGKPVPVYQGSSHEPSGRWVRARNARPALHRRVGRLGGQEPEQGPGGLGGGRVAAARPTPGRGSSARSRPIRRRRSGGRRAMPRRAARAGRPCPRRPPPGPAARRRCRRGGSRPSAPTTTRRRAGCARGSRRRAAPPGARRGRPHSTSASTTWAVTSSVGGSITSPKSQMRDLGHRPAGRCRRRTSPSRRPTLCIASSQSTPRRTAGCEPGWPERRRAMQDLGGVVGVGVVLVGELERPAPGAAPPRAAGASRRSAITSFESSHAAAFASAGSSGAAPASARAIGRQRGVPDRRQARLDAEALAVVEVQREGPVEAGQAPRDDRVVEREPERVQGQDRVDPRRLDAAPGAVRLLALADPARHPGLGEPPQPADGAAVVEARERQAAAQQRGPRPRRLRPGRRARPRRLEEELVEADRLREGRVARQDDHQRDEGPAGPAREPVGRHRRARPAAGSSPAAARAAPTTGSGRARRARAW